MTDKIGLYLHHVFSTAVNALLLFVFTSN